MSECVIEVEGRGGERKTIDVMAEGEEGENIETTNARGQGVLGRAGG
jgi:hypothetical protein